MINWIVEKRVGLGWLTGLLIYLLIGNLGPSASIGRRGACSHHGGVDHHQLYNLFSILGGITPHGSARVLLLLLQREPATIAKILRQS